MPTLKYRNFSEKFSFEEHTLINGIWRLGKRSGRYEAFQLWNDPILVRSACRHLDGRFGPMQEGVDHIIIQAKTTLYAYCEKILKHALALTEFRYPDWMDHEWIDDDPICRKVLFLSPDRKNAVQFCCDAIKAMVDDPIFAVSESVALSPCDCQGRLAGEKGWHGEPVIPKPGWIRLDLVAHVECFDKETEATIKEVVRTDRGYVPACEAYRFSLEQVQRHIVHVSDGIMALINAEDSRPPISDLDKRFHEAVDWNDFELAEELLRQGADINALTQGGSTALGKALWAPTDEDAGICWLSFLVEHGADPNFFGYEGDLALYWAVPYGPKIVKYLLENGADPNVNQYMNEQPWVVSSALDHAYSEYHCYETNPKWLDEVVSILEKAGAQYARDDYP